MASRKPKLAVSSLRVRNFKAIVDSKTVRFTPLTVFIGNNGSGKSSLMEAMSLIQGLAANDVDVALDSFRGLEHIRHKAALTGAKRQGKTKQKDPESGRVELTFSGWREFGPMMRGPGLHPRAYEASLQIGTSRDGEVVEIAAEHVSIRNGPSHASVHKPNAPHFQRWLGRSVRSWQFLDMYPRVMGQPQDRRRAGVRVLLATDGSNLAEYLLDMRDGGGEGAAPDRAEIGRAAFDGFVDAMRQVLPYASELRPVQRDYFERKVFLELLEPSAKGETMEIPGWLLSTGTLRIAALLAVLRHPEPPPLVCIEEIENGLDPRTIQLLVSEIQYAVERRGIQVMVTSHSPYFLDLVPLDAVVFVERGDKGPSFTRPADNEEMRGWAEKFSPGKLYSMNALTGTGQGGSK